MKKSTKILMTALIATPFLLLSGCNHDQKGPDQNDPGQSESTVTITNISDLIAITKAAHGELTTESYYAKGTISNVEDSQKNIFTLKDNTGSLLVYKLNDGHALTPKINVGDQVTIYGQLKEYGSKIEFYHPDLIDRVVNEKEILKEEECQTMTIKEAKLAEKGAKLKLNGIIASKTKTQKFQDNGFYLIDGTDSIYVHDEEAASQVANGNKVTILARKDYFLGESTTAAEILGYQGSNQVKDVVILSNDKKTDNIYDRSWIKDKTIKELMDTPLSTNITSDIYHVKGFINEVPGSGFTNYYINDIDNKTGTYVYSSNNGNDFSWLKEYDKKFVDMDLSIINAKLTTNDYIYRFMPIKVNDVLTSYQLNDTQKCEYILDYHILTKIQSLYNGDPQLHVPSTFNEDLWNISNATITYTSSDESVVKFTDNTMHVLNDGTSKLTIKAAINDKEVTREVTVEKKTVAPTNAITIKDAAALQNGQEATVKGIVVGSATLAPALYISDETGAIAITPKFGRIMKDIHVGDEVVFTGIRDFKQKSDAYKSGQTHLSQAVLVSNKYGNNQYPTKSFIDSDIETLKAISANTDVTTNIYKVKAKIEFTKETFSTNVYLTSLTNKDTKLQLYCSNSGQYNWLLEYEDAQSVDLEIALCNWNQKSTYKCVVLSASANGVKTNNTSNFR